MNLNKNLIENDATWEIEKKLCEFRTIFKDKVNGFTGLSLCKAVSA